MLDLAAFLLDLWLDLALFNLVTSLLTWPTQTQPTDNRDARN